MSQALLQVVAILLVVLLTGLLTVSGHLLYHNSQVGHRVKQLSSGYDSYTLIDTLYEDEAFRAFRQDPDRLNTLRTFYNTLYQSDEIELLSTFTQPLFIENFDKSDHFLYQPKLSEDPTELASVKSFQLNQKAFDFYQLKVDKGEPLDWGAISLVDSAPYPILLGSDYRQEYAIGDKIVAEIYLKKLTFEVKGFLAPNSLVYYKGNSEFYLDDMIVVPYPVVLPEVPEEDFLFEGILYFAMLNSQFVTRLPLDELLAFLRQGSQESGFVDFSLLEVSDFALKYEQLLSVVRHLQLLLIGVLVILSLLFLFLMISLVLAILRHQREAITVSWLMGYDLRRRILWRVCFLLYLSSVLTCLSIELFLMRSLLLFPLAVVGNAFLYQLLYHRLVRQKSQD